MPEIGDSATWFSPFTTLIELGELIQFVVPGLAFSCRVKPFDGAGQERITPFEAVKKIRNDGGRAGMNEATCINQAPGVKEAVAL